MNALIAPQSMNRAPFIGHTPVGVPIDDAVDILNEGSQSGALPNVVLLDDARKYLPAELQRGSISSVVWVPETELRAIAPFVSIVPRFISLPNLATAPKLSGVINITPDMLRTVVSRSRVRSPGYMVVMRDLSPKDREEARRVAKRFNLREVGLSLTSAVTVAVFSSVVLKRPWRENYSTKTLSSTGKHLAVGPGNDGRITMCPVWPNECYPALEFIR